MAELIDLDLKKESVKKQPCFSQLNDAEIDVLTTLLVEKIFQPGDVIVKEGEHVDSVYIIIRGSADVIHTHRKDQVNTEEKIATLKDGSAIGLSDRGFYSLTGLRTATVRAASELLTLRLSVPMFRGFALAYPHASEVMRQQAERL
jgi:CRP-like cAMP-binding protein